MAAHTLHTSSCRLLPSLPSNKACSLPRRRPHCRSGYLHAVPETAQHTGHPAAEATSPVASQSRLERGLQQQHTCSSSSSAQASSKHSLTAVLPLSTAIITAAWAHTAHAEGVGDAISDFVAARSSFTTGLATIAFLLLLVLTAGVSLALEQADGRPSTEISGSLI